MKPIYFFWGTRAALIFAASAHWTFGQTLFTENFDADHSANWVVNKATGVNLNDAGNSANFFFDYSSVGIPSAPNSTGGTTRGLKLQANLSGGIFSGLSVSPVGQTFSGDYTLSLDLWMNYNGRLDGGGNGSTQVSSFGLGTAGATAQWAGGAQDSVWFGATGDAGASVDYRAYSPAAGTGYTAPSGVFAAGTGTSPDARNNLHSYYARFGNATAPAAQIALFPQQTNATGVGAAGFAWRNVEVSKLGNTVTWTLDGLTIATVDASALTLGGGNILVGHFDINATSSTDANAASLLFGLVDNIRVTVIPEPSVVWLGAVGAGLLAVRRRVWRR